MDEAPSCDGDPSDDDDTVPNPVATPDKHKKIMDKLEQIENMCVVTYCRVFIMSLKQDVTHGITALKRRLEEEKEERSAKKSNNNA